MRQLVGFGGGMVAFVCILITHAAGGGIAAYTLFILLALALFAFGATGVAEKSPPTGAASGNGAAWILGGLVVAAGSGLFGVCVWLDSCWQESVRADVEQKARVREQEQASAAAAAIEYEKREREEARLKDELAKREHAERVAKLRALTSAQRLEAVREACPAKAEESCSEPRLEILVEAAATDAERKRLQRLAETAKKQNARANRSIKCCDGSLSPSCMCGGSRRGCCSHHGGVCGCE